MDRGADQGRGSGCGVSESIKGVGLEASASGLFPLSAELAEIRVDQYNFQNPGYAWKMNLVQLYIVVGLPTLTVLVGMFLNQRSFDRLESSLGARMDRIESRMDRLEARLDRIEADLREFFRSLGQHDARLDNLEKRRV